MLSKAIKNFKNGFIYPLVMKLFISEQEIKAYKTWKPLLNCYAIGGYIKPLANMGIYLFDTVFNAERLENGMVKQLWHYYSKRLSIKEIKTRDSLSALKKDFFELLGKAKSYDNITSKTGYLNLAALIYSITLTLDPDSSVGLEIPKVKIDTLTKPKRFKKLKSVLETELDSREFSSEGLTLEQILNTKLTFEDAISHHILAIDNIIAYTHKSEKFIRVDTITLPYLDIHQTSRLLFFNNSQDFENYNACKLLGLFTDPDLHRRENDPRIWIINSLKHMAHRLFEDIKVGETNLDIFIYGIRYLTLEWLNNQLWDIVRKNGLEHKIESENLLDASYKEIETIVSSYLQGNNLEEANVVKIIKDMALKNIEEVGKIKNPVLRDMQVSLATWRAVTLINQQKLKWDINPLYKDTINYWYQQYKSQKLLRDAIQSAVILAYVASKKWLMLDRKTVVLWSLALAELIIEEKDLLNTDTTDLNNF